MEEGIVEEEEDIVEEEEDIVEEDILQCSRCEFGLSFLFLKSRIENYQLRTPLESSKLVFVLWLCDPSVVEFIISWEKINLI